MPGTVRRKLDVMTWYAIPGFDGFYANTSGEIRGRRGRVMKPRRRPDGYLDVFIEGRRIFVHKLVLLAFSGPKPSELHQARHLNGRRDDNRPDNLVWGSVQENRDDKVRHGKTTLTIPAVEQLRSLAAEGYPAKVLAALFKVSVPHVHKIIRGARWKGNKVPTPA